MADLALIVEEVSRTLSELFCIYESKTSFFVREWENFPSEHSEQTPLDLLT